MKQILTLSMRHIKNFYRDKAAVFFSFLSVIILLGVYILFLGNIYGTIELGSSLLKLRFVVGFVMGGVLVVNTLTLSLGVIGTYVGDRESKKINSMLITPVSRWKIIVSYFLSTYVLTLLLTIVMFLLVFLYMGFNGFWYSFLDLLQIVGIIMLFVTISTPIILFLVSLINGMNAFGGLSSIVGTLIGFISGIYIPLSAFDPFTLSIASIMPFSHMTIYLRRLLIGNDIISVLPAEAMEANALNYLEIFGLQINIYVLFGIVVLLSFGFLALAYFKMNKKEN